MRGPLSYLVDVFQSNPRWISRVLGAGGVGLFIATAVLIRHYAEMRLNEAIGILLGLPGFFLLAGILLATMDYIERQIKSGKQVRLVPKILFGMGMWSILLWFVLILIVGFPLAELIGNLTWRKH